MTYWMQIVKPSQMLMFVFQIICHYCNLTNIIKVAGLKEDIGLKGNEYSILLSLFTAGHVFPTPNLSAKHVLLNNM